MVRLNTSDAAALARVAKYGRFGEARRTRMLEHVSPEAKAIGEIIITGRSAGANEDYIRAATDINKWAASRGRKSNLIREERFAVR
jgi:hypothetical protein